MSEETKDVTTLTEEQNTEPTLDQVTDNTSEPVLEELPEDYAPSGEGDDETLGMSDEEFLKYLETGKFEKKGDKEHGSDSDPTRQTSVLPNQRSDSESGHHQGLGSDANRPEKPRESSPAQAGIRQDEPNAASGSVNYKQVYESIFKPFKANGKEIAPKTPEDVISLMQMGANYTKKMTALAPMRRISESLSKAGIGEDEINFLIDVHNGNQEAIKALLQKHKVEPIELDMSAVDYKSGNNLVSDADVEYINMLEDIQPSLPKIREVCSSWDKQSVEKLTKDPDLLYKLHQEIGELGRFDTIQAQLDRERTFGRYKGVSDLEAYSDLAAKYVAEQQARVPLQTNPTNGTKTSSNPKPVPDKRKAAPTRSAPGANKSKYTMEDLYNMSDEEFKRINVKDLV